MSKQNAEVLARTARSEAASITNGTKRTIIQILNNWNECVKQSSFMGVYDFPTTGYSRKSQIVADLLRCADQLDDYCEPNPHAPQTVEQQVREFNAALTRVLDVEEAHSEALKEDKRFNWLANRWGLFWAGSDYLTRRTMIEDAHKEALEMNEKVNEALLALSSDALSVGWHLHSPTMKAQAIRIAHAAALEIDTDFNLLASLRHMRENPSQVHRC